MNMRLTLPPPRRTLGSLLSTESLEQSQGSRTVLAYVMINVLFLAAYVAAGLAGLELSLPSLEVSPFWPAAGVAVGAWYLLGRVVVPGLFGGMLFISFVQQHLHVWSWEALAMSVTLSTFALAQCALAAILIRNRLAKDTGLIRGREVAQFMFQGAILGGLVSPTLSTLALLALGRLDVELALGFWTTRWLGDATGIAIVAPMVLTALSRRRSIWQPRFRAVTVPVLTTLVLVSMFLWHSNQEDSRRGDLLLQQKVERLDRTFASELKAAEASVMALSERIRAENTALSTSRVSELARPWLRLPLDAFIWQPERSQTPGVRVHRAAVGLSPSLPKPKNAALTRAPLAPLAAMRPYGPSSQPLGFLILTGVMGDQASIHTGTLAGTISLNSLIEHVGMQPEQVEITVRQLDAVAGAHGSRVFSIGDQLWSIDVAAAHTTLGGAFSWETWWLHALGLSVTGLLTALLLILSGRYLVAECAVTSRTAEMESQVERRAAVIRHMNIHNEMLRRIIEGHDSLEDLLQMIVNTASWVNPTVMCTLSLLDQEGENLRLVVSRSVPESVRQALSWIPISPGSGSCSHAAIEGVIVRVDDVSTDPRWKKMRAVALQADIVASWSQPIFSGTNKLLGTFCLYFSSKPDDPDAFSELVKDISNLAALAIERYQTASRVQELAFYDSLTGLPNRESVLAFLKKEIAYCDENGCNSAVLLIDIDDLKDVNDSLGHPAGDNLICELAARLKRACEEHDVAARLCGDEFVLVVGSRVKGKPALAVCITEAVHRIRDELARPFFLDGYNHFVTASIGASGVPQPGRDAGQIIQQADTAMYRAKRQGKNLFCSYNSDMTASSRRHFDLEKGLVEALIANGLELHYQLQFDSSKRPVAAEALLRWHHPTRGLVSAGEFIEVAEKSSLIIRLGNWVIEEACRQVGHLPWLDYIAINMSPKQLERDDFVPCVLSAIRRNGIRPDQLALEITEHSLIENLEDNLSSLRVLKEAGVRISIDDFGTGYSSLFYLRHLPLNQIKIDKTFIAEILEQETDALIVASIIELAREMSLDLVAEGVETQEQFQLLVDLNCERFQGFLLGRPRSCEDLMACAPASTSRPSSPRADSTLSRAMVTRQTGGSHLAVLDLS